MPEKRLHKVTYKNLIDKGIQSAKGIGCSDENEIELRTKVAALTAELAEYKSVHGKWGLQFCSWQLSFHIFSFRNAWTVSHSSGGISASRSKAANGSNSTTTKNAYAAATQILMSANKIYFRLPNAIKPRTVRHNRMPEIR